MTIRSNSADESTFRKAATSETAPEAPAKDIGQPEVVVSMEIPFITASVAITTALGTSPGQGNEREP